MKDTHKHICMYQCRYLETFFAQIFKSTMASKPSSKIATSSSSGAHSPSSDRVASPLLTERQQTHAQRSPKEITYTPLRKQQLGMDDTSNSVSPGVEYVSSSSSSRFSFSHRVQKSTPLSSSSSPQLRSSTTPTTKGSPLERQVHFVVIDEVCLGIHLSL